ncbi:MAG: hypothetical protein KY476_00375 [Planctomycetes bacterium]|nr:hypothetical protein [Planctomycetota bacterium]
MRAAIVVAFSLVACCCGAAACEDRLPAFPGAEGFGAHTPGGRGGRVLEVVNLDDDGPGSLRAAIVAEHPRIIVFRIGGTIELPSPLAITHPFVTIAGQTAPGGGITLKSGAKNLYAPLQIKTHDVVIRHIRSRPGPGAIPPPGHEGSNVDALTIADLQRPVYNVIIDHCSFSWSVDEVVNSWYDARDVTVQWCIMAEGLDRPQDRPGAGSKGPLFGGKGSDRISVHHNLIAHNVGRNPMIKATGLVGRPPADTDHDGLPDDWERRHRFDPADPGDAVGDADGDGYTNVEELLNATEPRGTGSDPFANERRRTTER